MSARFIPQKPSYTLKEAAAYISATEQTVRQLIKRGLLDKSCATRRVIIPGASLETFFERTK